MVMTQKKQRGKTALSETQTPALSLGRGCGPGKTGRPDPAAIVIDSKSPGAVLRESIRQANEGGFVVGVGRDAFSVPPIPLEAQLKILENALLSRVGNGA
jgi:hypothetical protein